MHRIDGKVQKPQSTLHPARIKTRVTMLRPFSRWRRGLVFQLVLRRRRELVTTKLLIRYELIRPLPRRKRIPILLCDLRLDLRQPRQLRFVWLHGRRRRRPVSVSAGAVSNIDVQAAEAAGAADHGRLPHGAVAVLHPAVEAAGLEGGLEGGPEAG